MNTSVSSVREKSSQALTSAIHSPSDRAETLERARRVLSLFYEPDLSPHDRAAMLEEFADALAAYPEWAMHRAFDAWVKQHKRRPSPGEIVILAQAEIRPLTDELKQREPREPRLGLDDQRVTPEAAAEILAKAGFTPRRMHQVRAAPRTCASLDEAEAWSQGEHPGQAAKAQLSDDSPEVQRVRAENPLMQAARRDAGIDHD